MSDAGSGAEDIDDILAQLEVPTQKSKPSPSFASVSKRKPFSAEGFNNPGGDEDAKPRTATSDLPSSPLKKSNPLVIPNIPVTSRPKTNASASLLFGSKDSDEPVPGKKTFMKNLQPSFLKPLTQPPAAPKTSSDWLGVGTDAPVPLNILTPLVQSKDSKPRQDPFQFKRDNSDPSSFKPLQSADHKPVSSTLVQQPNPDFNADSGLPSFLDKLTTKTSSEPKDPSAEGDAPSNTLRKKVITIAKPTGSATLKPSQQHPTLQVPSHVIDEAELKRMFLCQKDLYDNQVSMLERSYKEQMEYLSQSFARRELMLKEELKSMQKDNDERIGRLKTELAEAELRPLQFRGQSQDQFQLLTKVSDQLKTLEIPTNADLATIHRNNASLEPSTILDAITNVLEVKLSAIAQASTGIDNRLVKTLELISAQVETHIKIKREAVASSGDGQEKVAKKVETLLDRVTKEQRRLRETLIKSTVTSMTQALESKHTDDRKKDRISVQLKEFRRDIHRLFATFEGQHDSLLKTQRNMDDQQKTLAQNFHDLLTWLQVTLSHGSPTLNQGSVQNEMEIKMLKDERNTLSETIALTNVEKRKLHDERLQLEADRREMDRRRAQVQDLETTLRNKMTDVEDAKKVIESSRYEQVKATSDLSRKMIELEKDRSRCRDKTQTMEAALNMEKQRQAEERAEIVREREFLEKLRHQFLCPGCLRLVRSEGDGHDPKANIIVPQELAPVQLDLQRQGTELKNMISKYYNDTS